MNLLIYKTEQELFGDLAAFIIATGEKAIAEKDCFNLVLTGGNSPKKLHQKLVEEYKDKFDWSKVYFFFGDERNVPPNHENYNGLMAKTSLLEPLGIPDRQIFYVNTALPPEQAAAAYDRAINEHFNGSDLAFDLVLLGMGDDAHTASLFPETPILAEQNPGVASVFVEKLDTYRISMTAPLINKAAHVVFLVFGESKATALSKVFDKEIEDTETYPAKLIRPINGSLTWYVDEAAASLLE
ncbi:6-phosphogluconolactonase [Pedobacter yulinensis]|uniref:6-phosphogluconolactonase n=1 Tax=Pedobacter yulinensis TaxID=2126353 RepID=A0A2T3HI29_9SPHI|nr:6-phosphogluconolactonase [Pedobacter yulinensis]PST82094.1 6-phosphogluconolactonase [Pedobacter yulinensis]